MESKQERLARGAIEKRLDRLTRQTRTLQRVRNRRSKVDDERIRQVAKQIIESVVRLDERVDNLRDQALQEVARLDQRISQVRDQALSRHLLLEARVAALENPPPPIP